MFWSTDIFVSSPRELLYHAPITGATDTGWRDFAGTFTLQNPFTTGVHQWAFVFDPVASGGAVRLYIDGVQISTGPVPWTPNAAAAAVTFLSNGNIPLNMDMGHFLWYSDAHSAGIVGLFSAWAGSTWGY
jgi:hypothetical protein